MRKKRRKKPFGHAPNHTPKEGPKSDSESVQKDGAVVDTEGGVASFPGGVSSENLSSSPSLASLGSDLEIPRYVALDTLLGNQSSSEAEAEAAVTATAMVLSATLSSPSPSFPRPHPQVRNLITQSPSIFFPQSSPPAPQPPHTLSPDELREALLAMVRTKDELEEANK